MTRPCPACLVAFTTAAPAPVHAGCWEARRMKTRPSCICDGFDYLRQRCKAHPLVTTRVVSRDCPSDGDPNPGGVDFYLVNENVEVDVENRVDWSGRLRWDGRPIEFYLTVRGETLQESRRRVFSAPRGMFPVTLSTHATVPGGTAAADVEFMVRALAPEDAKR